MKKVHLPGLNGIRAIAALMVVMAHFTPLFAEQVGLSFGRFHEKAPGNLAVTLFFVLSGYLISYLLILEKAKFNKIDLKAFYMRRVLRIWPLYYLIIILSVVVMSLLYGQNLLDRAGDNFAITSLFMVYAGNFAYAIYHIPTFQIFTSMTILWSVGVEEQFYLFWPLLLKYFKKNINVFAVFLLIYLIIKIVIRVFFAGTFLSQLIILTRLDCMAIGAIGAALILDKKQYSINIIRFIFNNYIQLISWIIFILGFTLMQMPFGIFNDDFYAIFFIIIILNVSQNKNTIIKLETGVFNFLGRISYGIYMYHVLVMVILQKLISKPADNAIYYFMYLIIVLFLTIAFAYMSNKYIESFFLKKKDSIAKIKNKS